MKHKFKRGLSLILSCALVLTLLPATALAAGGGHNGQSGNYNSNNWYKDVDTSTVTFKIVNGTWNADQNFGGEVNDDGTEVSFTVYKHSNEIGYVYECGEHNSTNSTTTMETILNAILGDNAATYITPDTGYKVTSQDWAVERGGITGSSASANEQMQAIKNNIHGYDTFSTPDGGFAAGTIYVLTLTKQSYSVTATIDNEEQENHAVAQFNLAEVQ